MCVCVYIYIYIYIYIHSLCNSQCPSRLTGRVRRLCDVGNWEINFSDCGDTGSKTCKLGYGGISPRLCSAGVWSQAVGS
jgi:hypothetical protein